MSEKIQVSTAFPLGGEGRGVQTHNRTGDFQPRPEFKPLNLSRQIPIIALKEVLKLLSTTLLCNYNHNQNKPRTSGLQGQGGNSATTNPHPQQHLPPICSTLQLHIRSNSIQESSWRGRRRLKVQVCGLSGHSDPHTGVDPHAVRQVSFPEGQHRQLCSL